MEHYGSVKIEGDSKNPKIVSELKDGSVKGKHINKDDIFVFKNIQIEDENGNKYKLKIKSNKIEVEKKLSNGDKDASTS